MENLKTSALIVIAGIIICGCGFLSGIHFSNTWNTTIPIPIFKSSTTQVPTMRKVLSFENIRVYQYSDSLGTTTIFASEYDFIGVK